MASPSVLNPIASTAVGAFGVAGAADMLTQYQSDFFMSIFASKYMGFGNTGLLLTAAPLVVLAMSGRDLLAKERTGLSKTFAGVAAASAAVATVASFNPIAGDSLLPLLTCYAATAVAGAASLVSHLTRNTSMSASVQFRRNPPPAAPKP
jgi:drug/metabolite transporter (DMT)-like permease